jgi:2-hydroxychromene-2-carboxylate isomerase
MFGSRQTRRPVAAKQADSEAMKLIVYGDFNCPYSCLASARAEALVSAGLAEVDWRAPSRPADGEIAEMFEREVAEVVGLLRSDEVFPMRQPPVQPNTAQATARFAALPEGDRRDARRRLFEALWFDGRDTGDPDVVAELVAPAERDGDALAAEWRTQWVELERRLVPMLVLPDGTLSRGLGALKRLADFASPN